MNLLFEAKYAWRLLRKTPGFTTTSVLIVGISLAIAMLVFSIVYRFWLMPLEFSGSRQWYAIQTYDLASGIPDGPNSVDLYAYSQLREAELPGIKQLSGFYNLPVVFNDGEISRSVKTMVISPEILSSINARPYHGQNFRTEDGIAGNTPTVILSYDSWQTYFGGREDIIGQQTRLDGELKTIVGVMSDGFSFVFGADFWLPMFDQQVTALQEDAWLTPVIQFEQGMSPEVLNSALRDFRQNLRAKYPEFYSEDYGYTLVPINLTANAQAVPIYVVMAVVALILILFGAVNIGLLLSGRIMERNRELAIRSAVGSSKIRIIGQSLWEGFYIISSGWMLGIGLTLIVLAAVNPLLEMSIESTGAAMPERWHLKLDLISLLFSAITVLFIWLASTLAPVAQSFKQDISKTLATGVKGGKGEGHKAAALIVGCQTVLACFLLIVSGTLAVSLNKIINTDFGIATESRVVGHVNLRGAYKNETDRYQYIEDMESELAKINSSLELEIVSSLPALSNDTQPLLIEDYFNNDNSAKPAQPMYAISNNALAALEIDLIAGRAFDLTDTRESLPVTIIDEHFAKLYWPKQNAIGKRFQVDPDNNGPWLTVVGVSRHVRDSHQFISDSDFLFYRPISQTTPQDFWLLVESTQDPTVTKREIQSAANNVNADIPISRLDTLKGFFYGTLTGIDILSTLFIVVAIITLFLAVSGIFGILARSIINSARDIGVRRALGSANSKVFQLYLRKGLAFLLVGCAIGGSLALIINNVLSSILISTATIYIYPVMILVISALALFIVLASYLPVKKIIMLEPGDALRYE